MFRWIITFFLFALSGNSDAQVEIPLTIKKPFIEQFSNFHVVEGDLNNDGIGDFVVQVTEEGNGLPTDKLAVYFGKTDGSYTLVTKSQSYQYGVSGVEIKKGSIFVQVFHNMIPQSYDITYQFKYLKNNILLIGTEEHSHITANGNEFRSSVNYLTGKKIETNYVNRKTKVTESFLRGEEKKPIKLEEFMDQLSSL
jgi:hypothetical protein